MVDSSRAFSEWKYKFYSQVRLGDHTLSTTGEGSLPEITFDLSETNMIIHENYDELKYPNDIAIIELPEEVDLTTYTPACMAKTADTNTFDGKKALAYGEITAHLL